MTTTEVRQCWAMLFPSPPVKALVDTLAVVQCLAILFPSPPVEALVDKHRLGSMLGHFVSQSSGEGLG